MSELPRSVAGARPSPAARVRTARAALILAGAIVIWACCKLAVPLAAPELCIVGYLESPFIACALAEPPAPQVPWFYYGYTREFSNLGKLATACLLALGSQLLGANYLNVVVTAVTFHSVAIGGWALLLWRTFSLRLALLFLLLALLPPARLELPRYGEFSGTHEFGLPAHLLLTALLVRIAGRDCPRASFASGIITGIASALCLENLRLLLLLPFILVSRHRWRNAALALTGLALGLGGYVGWIVSHDSWSRLPAYFIIYNEYPAWQLPFSSTGHPLTDWFADWVKMFRPYSQPLPAVFHLAPVAVLTLPLLIAWRMTGTPAQRLVQRITLVSFAVFLFSVIGSNLRAECWHTHYPNNYRFWLWLTTLLPLLGAFFLRRLSHWLPRHSLAAGGLIFLLLTGSGLRDHWWYLSVPHDSPARLRAMRFVPAHYDIAYAVWHLYRGAGAAWLHDNPQYDRWLNWQTYLELHLSHLLAARDHGAITAFIASLPANRQAQVYAVIGRQAGTLFPTQPERAREWLRLAQQLPPALLPFMHGLGIGVVAADQRLATGDRAVTEILRQFNPKLSGQDIADCHIAFWRGYGLGAFDLENMAANPRLLALLDPRQAAGIRAGFDDSIRVNFARDHDWTRALRQELALPQGGGQPVIDSYMHDRAD